MHFELCILHSALSLHSSRDIAAAEQKNYLRFGFQNCWEAPKTESSNRTVYLPRAVVEELISMQDAQKSNKRLLAYEYHDYNLVVAKVNGMPYELRTIDKMFYKLIEEKALRPVVFHILRHSSTSLKLKLSKGNIKAVQGDTGHAEARMVTDTYAHSIDEDRKLIAQEIDSGFFDKVNSEAETPVLDNTTIDKLKLLIKQHPELIDDLLNTNKSKSINKIQNEYYNKYRIYPI